MILVDTSVWIDFLKGTGSAERRKLHELIEDEQDVSIAGLILTEILQGITANDQFFKTRDYFMEFPIFEPKVAATYVSAAFTYGECRKKGKTVRSTVDCVIAAICLENDLTILHKDRDYNIIEECAGLKVLRA